MKGTGMAFYQDRILPKLIKVAMNSRQLEPLRRRLLAQARGRVLELGVGAGANFPCYPQTGITEVVGVDPHPEFGRLSIAAASGLPCPFSFVQCGAEQMPFSDQSFDTIVSTFTLCSVVDSGDVMREVRRLLKPGGQFLLLEHGLSPDRFPRLLHKNLNGLQQCIAGGCQLTKDHFADLEQAGFKKGAAENFYLPKAPRFLAYIYQGAFSAPLTEISDIAAQ
jgi:ubiquinone/menaquinone biosynthesis C-methylase UbiE